MLAIRKELDLYANLRPVTFYDSLADASPLKKEYIEGVDFIIVRELTGAYILVSLASVEQKEMKRQLSTRYFISVQK